MPSKMLENAAALITESNCTEIPDDKLEETFMFEFELDGGAHYDLYWTCVNDWDGDFVGQTGCVRNISGSSLFAAKMCDWMDDY